MQRPAWRGDVEREDPEPDDEGAVRIGPEREAGGGEDDQHPGGRPAACVVEVVEPCEQRGDAEVADHLRADRVAACQGGEHQHHRRPAHPWGAAAPRHRQPDEPGGEQRDGELAQPQPGRPHRIEHGCEGRLGEPFMVDPRQPGGGVGEVVGARHRAGAEDQPPGEQVHPEIIVSLVLGEEVERAAGDQQRQARGSQRAAGVSLTATRDTGSSACAAVTRG